MPVPMIEIATVRYLPSFHVALAPFGPEVALKNYLVAGDRLVVATIRVGDPALFTFFGVGVDINRLLVEVPLGDRLRLSVDASAHLWCQPVLEAPKEHPRLLLLSNGESGIGGLLSATARLWVLENVGLQVELGLKSSGCLEGEPLDAGPVVRAGLAFEQ